MDATSTKRTFTSDETYALECQFRYGATRDDYWRKVTQTYSRGSTLSHRELASAYSLGAAGNPPVPAMFGDAGDVTQLPSVAVHRALGYLVASDWLRWAGRIVDRGDETSPIAAAWLSEATA